MPLGSLREWLVPGSVLGQRVVVDGRRGSFKKELVSGGGYIVREGFDDGFCCTYVDADGGEVIVTQDPETNTVAMGKYATVFYDREGQLLGLDVSLLCVGMMSARFRIPASLLRSNGYADYFQDGLDVRMIVELAGRTPGLTFLETNSKGPSRILGGDRLRPTQMVDLFFDGPTPLLELPVTVYQDDRALYVLVNGVDGYSWAQLCRNRINPRLVGYGLTAQEMDDLFRIAFPPSSFLTNKD